MKQAAPSRRDQRRDILSEIKRIHNIGANVMGTLRLGKMPTHLSMCQTRREEAAGDIRLLNAKVAAFDPDDFAMKVAADTLRLCAACDRDADFHCEQVNKYLKTGKSF